VFENRVLRRIFGPKREEVARGWRRLHNEGIHNLYTTPNVIRVIKSKRVRWVGTVQRMGEVGNACKISRGNLKVRHHMGDLGVDGRIILKWILKK
jgi:hypothetical protein